MLKTRFTELVGCAVPIQQAGMGSFANPLLAAAATAGGGQGMVSVYGDPPDLIAAQLDDARGRTQGVLGANFILHFVDPGQIRECVAAAAERAGQGRRRVVASADVDTAVVSRRDGAADVTEVELDAVVALSRVASFHIDEQPGGDAADLLWYDVTELDDVITLAAP